MYRHILIPIDGTSLAEKALEAGVDYARETGAKVTLFTALPEYHVPSEAELMARRGISLEAFETESRKKAEALLGEAAAPARWAGIDFDTDFALSDRPYEAIIEAAKRNGCDAIFMSSHGRKGIDLLLHGSQTSGVLKYSDIPTLVCR
jgi:nucleotide-binding universal stress UspA family protein